MAVDDSSLAVAGNADTLSDEKVTTETTTEGESTKGEPANDTRRARNPTSEPKASAAETEAREPAAKAERYTSNKWHASNKRHASNETTTTVTPQEMQRNQNRIIAKYR